MSASSTSCETGTGTTGPIMRVRWKPLSILCSGNVFRQGDANPAANRFEQFVRPDRAVGVAEPPELFRIAKIFGRDVIEPFTFGHGVLLKEGEILRRRYETPLEISDFRAIGHR